MIAPTTISPVFEFHRYGLAIHFVIRLDNVDSQRDLRSSSNFESLERDLLSSVHRELRLTTLAQGITTENVKTLRGFGSRSLEAPRGWEIVEVRYPATLAYAAEGKQCPLFPPNDAEFIGAWPEGTIVPRKDNHGSGAFRCRRFRFLPSITEFRSGVLVLNLAFAPVMQQPSEALNADLASPDQETAIPESVLNEWDLIVLSKLWQGGEGIGPEAGAHSAQELVRFSPCADPSSAFEREHQNRSLTINQLAEATLKGEPDEDCCLWRRRKLDRFVFEPKAGTYELELDSPTLYQALQKLDDASDSKNRDTIAAIGRFNRKLITAIQAIPGASPTTPVPTKPARPATAHWQDTIPVEGILCGLLDYFDIGKDEIEDVFANPVMADDNTFLDIHKGTMLMLSRSIRWIRPVDGRPLGVNPYLLLPQAVLLHNEYWLRYAKVQAGEHTRRHRIAELQIMEVEIRAALQQHRLPNIFHYRTEQNWYRAGHAVRGLDDLQQDVEKQLERILDDINDNIRTLRERDGQIDVYIFSFLGLVIAVLQGLAGWKDLQDLGWGTVFKVCLSVFTAFAVGFYVRKKWFR